MAQSQDASARAQSRGKEFVRSFLFSVKIESPLARLHVVTKLLVILALSVVIVQWIRTDAPDPLGTILMISLALLGLQLAGVLRWVFHSYLLILFPSLFGMALTWVIFNPDPGAGVLAPLPAIRPSLSGICSMRWPDRAGWPRPSPRRRSQVFIRPLTAGGNSEEQRI